MASAGIPNRERVLTLRDRAEGGDRMDRGVPRYAISDHAALAILEEYRAHQARAVAEYQSASPIANCKHDALTVYRTLADLSDTVTEYGHCPRCDRWITRTTWLGSGTIEQHTMDTRDRERLQSVENLRISGS